jgi:V8-like Glu-specific endopeptidase
VANEVDEVNMSDSTSSYPYDTVVRITDTIGGESWQGSGVLISPDEVLTASHVVYIDGVGTATNIVVTPGYDDGSSPYGSVAGTSFHYEGIDDEDRSITNEQSQFDYAVIHLATPITSAGYMGLEADYPGGEVNITGYPASAGGAQVTSTQPVTLNPDYTLLDGTALGEGSSGGPVWTETANGPEVVGLVSSESDTNSTGYNTLITTAAFDQIETWVSEDNATPTPAPTPTPIIQAPAPIPMPPLSDRFGPDFNGNGTSDLLFQNNDGGLLLYWQMSAGSVSQAVAIGGATQGWQEVATGNFDGGSTSDILFENRDTGLLAYWQMSNGSVSQAVPIGDASPGWEVLGTGDFNGDGSSDILFENTNSGQMVDWQMADGALSKSVAIGGATYGWKFLGTGDFYGDGTSDILFQDRNTGLLLDWQMSNGTPVAAIPLAAATPGWKFVGTGDFNGDGTSDILFQDRDSGEVLYWQMANGAVTGGVVVGTASPGWNVVGTGDYNGGGTTDILLQNASSGQLMEWQMSGGGGVAKASVIGEATPDWKILPS